MAWQRRGSSIQPDERSARGVPDAPSGDRMGSRDILFCRSLQGESGTYADEQKTHSAHVKGLWLSRRTEKARPGIRIHERAGNRR
jgi:hypothetical protein